MKPRHNIGGNGPMRAIVSERTEERSRTNAEGDVLGTKTIRVVVLDCGHEVTCRDRTRVRATNRARCDQCPGALLGTRRNRQRRQGAEA